MIFAYGQINYTVMTFSDLSAYRAIAMESPKIASNVPQPFAYRILGPYIVGLLPIPDPLGFYTFTIISSLFLVVLFYIFLSHLGIQCPVAAFTTILFVFNKYPFGVTVWNYFQINDVLSMIYIIILFWTMLNCKWGIFALTLFLGALTRETSMIMIAVTFIYLLERKIFMDEGKKFLLAVVPAIACFLLLRFLINPAGGLGMLQAFLFHINKLTSVETWFRLLINTFIPLSLLPIIFFKRTVSFFKDKKYMLLFIVFVFISTLFGSNNERLMAPASIIFYFLIANIIQDYFYPYKGILFILMASAFLSSFHHLMGRYPLPSKDLTIILSASSLMAATVASYLFKIVVTQRARKFNEVKQRISDYSVHSKGGSGDRID